MLNKVYHRGLLQVSLILGAGIAILFWQTLLWGYVQVPTDVPAFFDPVMREAMPDIIRPQNPLLSDHVEQFYVWHYLAAQSMQNDGKVPLWNPHILAGQPLVGNAQPALFYPVNLLLFWLDPGLVTAFRSMFNMFVAGFFTFLFCRALTISKAGATLAAVAFAFSGALTAGPSYAYASCLALLPFIMWAGEKMLQDQARRYFWGLVGGIGVGITLLAGHPASAFHNLLIFGLYFSFRLLYLEGSIRQKGRLVLALGPLFIGGLLLGAVQWLPFVAWSFEGATVSRNPAWNATSLIYTQDWLPHLASIVTLLFPNFYGHPVDYTYHWPFATFQNYMEQSMYIGLIPLALAANAFFYTKKQQRTAAIIIGLLALVALAVALRLPLFEAVNHLPIFDRANNTRLKWYFAFGMAVMAGFGLDSFMAAVSGRSRKQAIYPTAAVLGAASLIVFGVAAGKYLFTDALSPDHFSYHLIFTIFSLRQIRTAVTIFVLAVGVILVIYLLWRDHKVNPIIIKLLLIGLTFTELTVMAYGYNTTVPKETVFPPVRLTELLAQDDDWFRVLGMPPAFWPNYGAVYGLYHVGGYDQPVQKRSASLFIAQGGRGYRQRWLPEWPLVDWMNVKYIITTETYDLPKLELILENGYRVYRNNNALPRAFMTYHFRIIPDEADLLSTMLENPDLLATTALLEQNLPPEQAQAIAPSPANANRVVITHYGLDEVVLRVTTETAGLLVP